MALPAARSPQRRDHRQGRRHDAELKGFFLLSVLKMLLVFTVVMVGVALLTLMERKVRAWMQNRCGPNRVGSAGSSSRPPTDQEHPEGGNLSPPSQPNLFILAPALSFIPALMLSG